MVHTTTASEPQTPSKQTRRLSSCAAGLRIWDRYGAGDRGAEAANTELAGLKIGLRERMEREASQRRGWSQGRGTKMAGMAHNGESSSGDSVESRDADEGCYRREHEAEYSKEGNEDLILPKHALLVEASWDWREN